jgi:hypothetical protein
MTLVVCPSYQHPYCENILYNIDMRSGEEVAFCEACPLKELCDGPIVQATQHNVDASFLSSREDAVGVGVSLATRFFDRDGHETDQFPPHTTIEDVANCTGKEVDYRTGFLNYKAVKNCGAFVLAIHRFRQSMRVPPK